MAIAVDRRDAVEPDDPEAGQGLALAAPTVLAALVGNLALAVMSRAAPTVNASRSPSPPC